MRMAEPTAHDGAMDQYLESVRYYLEYAQNSISNLTGYWNALPSSERAIASFAGGIVMVVLCIKDRDVEYSSVAMGLAVLLLFAYALSVSINIF